MVSYKVGLCLGEFCPWSFGGSPFNSLVLHLDPKAMAIGKPTPRILAMRWGNQRVVPTQLRHV